MVGLLDVNVLVALFDGEHPHHPAAHEWFGRSRTLGWATCPLTENGFLRVSTNPAFHPRAPALGEAVSALADLRAVPGHEFWPDDLSLCDGRHFDPSRVLGHRQITDAYILALAVHRSGRLVTFDRGIPLAAVAGSKPEHLLVLQA